MSEQETGYRQKYSVWREDKITRAFRLRLEEQKEILLKQLTGVLPNDLVSIGRISGCLYGTTWVLDILKDGYKEIEPLLEDADNG